MARVTYHGAWLARRVLPCCLAALLISPAARAKTAPVADFQKEKLQWELGNLLRGPTAASLVNIAEALNGERNEKDAGIKDDPEHPWSDQISHVVVATLPDPSDPPLALLFDRELDAIQRAAENQGYVLDHFQLPYRAPAAGEGTQAGKAESADYSQSLKLEKAKDALAEQLPDASVRACDEQRFGTMLLRKTNEAANALTHDHLLVLLVVEKPTDGVEMCALREALRVARDLEGLATFRPGAPIPPEPIKLLGPSFSGSTYSMHAALNDLRRKPWTQDVQIISGSATDFATQDILTQETSPDASVGKVRYSATVLPEKTLLYFTLDYILEKLEVHPEDVALFVEADTLYGHQLAADAHEIETAIRQVHCLSQSGEADVACVDGSGGPGIRHKQNDEHDLLVLPFPMHISSLRSRKDSLRKENDDTAPDSLRFARSEIELHLDTGQPAHVPNNYSGSTVYSDEQVISNLISKLSRYHMKYAGIVATDPADAIYIAKQLKSHFSDASVFFLGADILFTHPDVASALDGALVASPYPLSTMNQEWTYPYLGNDIRMQFPSTSAEGVYNALLALLHAGRPASTTAYNGYVRAWVKALPPPADVPRDPTARSVAELAGDRAAAQDKAFGAIGGRYDFLQDYGRFNHLCPDTDEEADAGIPWSNLDCKSSTFHAPDVWLSVISHGAFRPLKDYYPYPCDADTPDAGCPLLNHEPKLCGDVFTSGNNRAYPMRLDGGSFLDAKMRGKTCSYIYADDRDPPIPEASTQIPPPNHLQELTWVPLLLLPVYLLFCLMIAGGIVFWTLEPGAKEEPDPANAKPRRRTALDTLLETLRDVGSHLTMLRVLRLSLNSDQKSRARHFLGSLPLLLLAGLAVLWFEVLWLPEHTGTPHLHSVNAQFLTRSAQATIAAVPVVLILCALSGAILFTPGKLARSHRVAVLTVGLLSTLFIGDFASVLWTANFSPYGLRVLITLLGVVASGLALIATIFVFGRTRTPSRVTGPVPKEEEEIEGILAVTMRHWLTPWGGLLPLIAFAGCYLVAILRASNNRRFLFPYVFRELAIFSGVSPLVPVMLAIGAVILVWIHQIMRYSYAESLLRRFFVKYDRNQHAPFGIDRRRVIKSIFRQPNRLPGMFWGMGSGVALVVLVNMQSIKSFDRQYFDWLIFSCWVVLWVATISGLLKLRFVWDQTRHMLQAIAANPLIDAYQRLPPRFTLNVGLEFIVAQDATPNIDSSLVIRDMLLRHLCNLNKRLRETAYPHSGQVMTSEEEELLADAKFLLELDAPDGVRLLDALVRDLGDEPAYASGTMPPHVMRRHVYTSFEKLPAIETHQAQEAQRRLAKAVLKLAYALEEVWRSRPRRIRVEERGRKDESPSGIESYRQSGSPALAGWFLLAEELIALHTVSFLNEVFLYLRHHVVFTTLASIWMLLIASSYMFQPGHLLIWASSALLLAVVATTLGLLIQMNRDEVLSRVVRGNAGKIDWDWGFISKLAIYVAVPLLTFSATHVPVVASFLLKLVDPVLRTLR